MNKRYIKMLSGLGVGAIFGFAYYYYIGCASGTCAITSNPYISTAYGAMMGLIVIWPDKEKTDETLPDSIDTADGRFKSAEHTEDVL